MAGRREETALGTARARFVDGLPRKASELRGAVALLAAAPEAVRPREELRRRLHALYASAQVFRVGPLAEALRDAIRRLDGARDHDRSLTQDELDALASLAATLPALASGEADEGRVEPPDDEDAPAPPPAPARVGKSTLLGMPPSEPPAEPSPSVEPSVEPSRADRPERPGHDRPSARPPRRPSGSFTAGRPPSDRPPRPVPPLDTVISVLLVDDVESQARVRAALPAEGFELVAASDPEQGLRLARMGAPDVVVADRELVSRPGVDFVSRLRSDPLTDFVPVILLLGRGTANDLIAVREEGADATLGKPIEPEQLVRTVARLTGNLPEEGSPFDHLGDLTPSEIADRLADVLRRGIAESAESGKDVRVPMGDGAEVLAAAWSAIARVRATISQRSAGRVRFRDDSRRGGPAVMALVEPEAEEDVAAESGIEVTLEGRRIVVADDDPAVVWFFAGLLREEGADVFEAADGQEAIDEARRRRPDLIISDILMPEVDGFELCRELRRDPALSDVPVILLSWKEDFLQRMRELDSGASGYLRKEAGSAQILARVRDVLRPRARLEAQLGAGGEVRGRIEGIGMATLLRTVVAERPEARLMARDAWNLYEVDVRGGRLLDVTRTATDGSFARGPRALPQLLGVTSGRFTVTDSDGPVRGTFDGTLDQSLRHGTAKLGALLDSVSGRGLHHAAKVAFDEDVLASFLRTSPEPIKKLVERLQAGEGPRDLLGAADVAPHALEATLVDLARRGAIAEVHGAGGEDLVAEALHRRLGAAEAPEAGEPGRTPSERPTPAPPAKQAGEPAEGHADQGELGLSWLKSEETTGDIVDAAHRMAADKRTRTGRRERRDSVDSLDAPFTGSDDEEAPAAPERPARALEALPPDETEPTTEWRPELPPEEEPAAPVPLERRSGRPRPPLPPRLKDTTAPPPMMAEPEAAETGDVEAEPVPPVDRSEPALGRASVRPDEPAEPGTIGWIFLLIVLAVIGFVGYELVEGSFGGEEPEAAGGERAEPAEAPEQAGAKTPPVPDRPGAGEPEEVPPQELSFGRVLPGIEGAGDVEVGAGEGLLVVELAGEGPGPEVRVGEQELGRAPLRVALPEGRHELVFREGEETSYRYLFVRAGQTRIVQAP